MNVIYREPVISDAEVLFDLFLETWLDTYINESLGITEQVIRDYYAPREDKLVARRAAYENPDPLKLFQVAIMDNNIVGVCGINMQDNEIKALYVSPRYQRRGIGHGLFIWALDKLDHRRPIRLDVADYNHKALAFYQACGFKVEGKGNEHILGEGIVIPCLRMTRVIG